MKVSVDSNIIKIEASGLEFLKLKSEIAKRLGAHFSSGKDYIELPSSALYLIEDLIISSASGRKDIEAFSQAFNQHGIAKETASNILENGNTETISENWLEILDVPQASAVAAMTLPDLVGLCLFDEQGIGKTVMTIAAFDTLKERSMIDAMIVVCPKTMVSEWPKDIQKFTQYKYKVVEADGDRQKKYQAALTDFDVLVTNYEGLDPMLISLLAFADTKNYLLVVDESYYLKNGESVRSETATRLRLKCKRCFVLCGTPAPNSAYDLVNQFNLADLGYTFGGFRKSEDIEKDFEKIARLVEERGLFIRRLKNDVLKDVPEKNFHLLPVALKGKQALMYETAKSELELELKTLTNDNFKKSLASYFKRRAVLLQICCSPESVDPTFSDTPVKFVVLDDLLENLISQNRKVIIWSFFKKSIDDVMTRYLKYNPVRVDGSVKTSDRKNAVLAFQDNPRVKLFVGNPAAAGAGITLHASYDAVYLSYSNQAAHYLQSIDRIHRRGQVSTHVNYYLLFCKNTIEETEIVRLRGKELKQSSLLADHIPWPTSLDEALTELSQNV